MTRFNSWRWLPDLAGDPARNWEPGKHSDQEERLIHYQRKREIQEMIFDERIYSR